MKLIKTTPKEPTRESIIDKIREVNKEMLTTKEDIKELTNVTWKKLNQVKDKRKLLHSQIMKPFNNFAVDKDNLTEKALYTNAYEKFEVDGIYSSSFTIREKLSILNGMYQAYAERGLYDNKIVNLTNNGIESIIFSVMSDYQKDLHEEFTRFKKEENLIRNDLRKLEGLSYTVNMIIGKSCV